MVEGGDGGDDKKNTSGDYQVGYGKPPMRTRFQPGHSGNPKGKSKGTKNLATLLLEALNQPIAVTSNGERKKAQTAQVIIKQLVNQAAAGDLKAANMVFDQTRRIEEAKAARSESPASDSVDDALTMESLLRRMRAFAPGTQDGSATPGKISDDAITVNVGDARHPVPAKPERDRAGANGGDATADASEAHAAVHAGEADINVGAGEAHTAVDAGEADAAAGVGEADTTLGAVEVATAVHAGEADINAGAGEDGTAVDAGEDDTAVDAGEPDTSSQMHLADKEGPGKAAPATLAQRASGKGEK